MHLRSEMVLGVVTIIEEEPVIDFAVTAHAPGNRFIGIRPLVPVIAVQITEAVTEIPKGDHEEDHVTPVEEEHDQQCGCECGELEISPKHIAVAALS